MTDEQNDGRDPAVDEWFHGLSEDRKLVIKHRYEMLIEDVDDREEQITLFTRLITNMYREDVVNQLVADGIAEVVGVDEGTGEYIYGLTQKARDSLVDFDAA